jgi:catechol 2,3-dioxygenase-like lactoylglutathione lyase family enzyme
MAFRFVSGRRNSTSRTGTKEISMTGSLFRFMGIALVTLSGTGLAQTTAKPGLTGVAHVALRVSDVDAELHFIENLGFEQAFVHEEGGQRAFVFVKINDREFLEIHPRIPVGGLAPLPLGFDHICFVTTDAKAERTRWAQNGLNPSEVTKGPDGTLEFGAKDPSGRMTEALEILPGSQPERDSGKHLGSRRVSKWLIGIDLPVTDLAVWRRFYGAVGFEGTSVGSKLSLSSPANPDLQVILNTGGPDRRTRILFAADDPRRVAKVLTDAGIEVKQNDGEVIVHDPDGNAFVFKPARAHPSPKFDIVG